MAESATQSGLRLEQSSSSNNSDKDHRKPNLNVTGKAQQSADRPQLSIESEGILGVASNMENNSHPEGSPRSAAPSPEFLEQISAEVEKPDGLTRDIKAILLAPKSTMQLLDPAETSRVPYNNGYGDFSFGRLIDRWSPRFWNSAYLKTEDIPLNSHKSPSENTIAFDRSGHFPFFKLPLEVRQKIYRIILDPFFQYDDQKQKQGICLDILDNSPSKDLSENYTTYKEYCNRETVRRREYEQIMRVPSRSPPCTLAQFNKDKDSFLQKYKQHPNRFGGYYLTATVWKREIKNSGTEITLSATKPGRDYLFLEWMRGVSNVSNSFRQELSQVFWARTILTVPSNKNLVNVSHLLEHRPNICSGIKKLELCLYLEEKDSDVKTSDKFEDFCRKVSKNLQLEEFSLVLYFLQDDLEDLYTEKYSFLKRARSLKVSQNFEVLLRIRLSPTKAPQFYGPGMTPPGRIQAMRSYRTELEKEWGLKFRDLMLPDTLQPSKNPAALEKYLASRI